MRGTPSILGLIRLGVLFTVLGFLAITVGPVVAGVALAVLPFALVGFGVWLAYQALHRGPRAVAEQVRDVGQGAYEHAHRVVTLPVRASAGLKRLVQRSGQLSLRLVRSLVGIFSPALAGALVGGALGATGGAHYHDLAVRVPAGIAMGALIGLVVGLQWRRSEPKPIVLEPADNRSV